MRRDFYVYVLLDPRKPGNYDYGRLKFDYEPFYVGKGKGRRDRSHFRMGNVRADTNRMFTKHKVNTILAILGAGLEPLVQRVRTEATEDVAYRLEIRAIAMIGRRPAGPLTNGTNGGGVMSEYFTTEAYRERKGKASKKWHASLTPDQLVQRSVRLSQGVRKYILSCTPEELAERGRLISEGHKKRTPEEQLILQEMHRQTQLNLPPEVLRLKNKRTRRGLKKFYANRCEVHRLEVSGKLSKSVGDYWDNASEEERAKRAQAIKDGYAAKSKRSIKKKNSKIAAAIAAKHAEATVYDKRMRAFMVMVGLLMRNANIVDDDLKAKLRSKAAKFYSNEANLEHKPSVLRDKARKLIAA
jgi:hypothetical protein